MQDRPAKFLSTLSLRRATIRKCQIIPIIQISIHALLAESDGLSYFYIIKVTNFYPRSPCGERLSTTTITICIASFLSTLSLRRATVLGIQHKVGEFISIHALLAESDRPDAKRTSILHQISIHALLAESDRLPTALRTPHHRFLSTLSLRRATKTFIVLPKQFNDFYPRSPCGERQPAEHHANSQQEFLSTLSLRRATAYYVIRC